MIFAGPGLLSISLVWLLIVLAVAFLAVLAIRGVTSGGRQPSTQPPAPGVASPDVLVRTYRGRQQEDVLGAYQADAAALASLGYLPVSQSWGDGQYAEMAVLLAVVLIIFAVGFLILAYMLVVKPEGTLAVTYVRGEASARGAASGT